MGLARACFLLSVGLALAPGRLAAAVDDGAWVEALAITATTGEIALVPVVRDDAAPAVVEALLPLAEGREVAAGFVLEGVELGRFVRLIMTRSGERFEAAVYPAVALRAPRCVSGALGVVTQPVEGDAAVAAAICSALEGADAEKVFARVMAKTSRPAPRADAARAEPPSRVIGELLGATHAALGFHAAFLALLGLGAVAGWRVARRAFTAAQVAGLLGAVAVAALLRLVLPETTTLKEAYPFRGFGVVSLPFPGLGVPAELGMPVAHHAVVNLFWLLTGGVLPVDQVFFAVGLALASLTPLVLALALATWAPIWRGPMFAAWALALLPLHVKYAASEAVTVPSVFYQAMALLALGAWARRPQPPAPRAVENSPSPSMERGPGGEVLVRGPGAGVTLALLFVSLWMVFLVRPENPVLAPLFPLGAWLLARGSWRDRARAAWPVLGVTALALAPVMLLVLQGGPASGTGANFLREAPNLVGRLLPPHHAWLRFDLTPVYLPVAALAGVAWLAWRERGGLAILLGGLALLTPVYAAITSDVLPFGEGRYQVSLAPYWCGLAGFGLAALADLPLVGAARRAALGLGALAMIATSFALAPLVRDASYAPQAEFRFFRREVRPRLEARPPACPVLLVPTGEERYKDAEGDDFVQIVAKPPDLAVVDRRGLEKLQMGGARPACALFYRGLYCYRARGPQEADNPECRAILGSRGVTPQVEITVPNRPYHREVDPTSAERGELTFGLYRVDLPLAR